MADTTTLAVPKDFRDLLHKEYDDSNDFERLKSWAKDEYGYKDSITNEDLKDLIEQECDNNSITESDIRRDVRQAVEQALPAGLFE